MLHRICSPLLLLPLPCTLCRAFPARTYQTRVHQFWRPFRKELQQHISMTHSCGGTGAQNDAEVPVTQCSSSSSSSPSPVGASRRFSCDICGGAELAKYTCPACGVHTCSLPCQRQHKSSSGCPGVRSRCEFVRAEDMGLTTMCRCVALLCCMARAHFSHPPTLSPSLSLSLSLFSHSPSVQGFAISSRCCSRARQSCPRQGRRAHQSYAGATSSSGRQMRSAAAAPGQGVAACARWPAAAFKGPGQGR
jgi:hypothetical protein